MAHYSAARTLKGTEQQLFQSAARALCDPVAPYTVSCYRCVYPEVTAKVDVNQATKALRDVIQAWEQEEAQKSERLADVRARRPPARLPLRANSSQLRSSAAKPPTGQDAVSTQQNPNDSPQGSMQTKSTDAK